MKSFEDIYKQHLEIAQYCTDLYSSNEEKIKQLVKDKLKLEEEYDYNEDEVNSFLTPDYFYISNYNLLSDVVIFDMESEFTCNVLGISSFSIFIYINEDNLVEDIKLITF